MTIEEVEQAVAGKKIIRHKSEVFFTTYSGEEAQRYQVMGARVRADLLDPLGQPTEKTFWEVHLSAMLDPATEIDENGREIDLRPGIILEHFRARDGFEIPERLIR
jgi:hypothetical protein